jgi:hypothetical protein
MRRRYFAKFSLRILRRFTTKITNFFAGKFRKIGLKNFSNVANKNLFWPPYINLTHITYEISRNKGKLSKFLQTVFRKIPKTNFMTHYLCSFLYCGFCRYLQYSMCNYRCNYVSLTDHIDERIQLQICIITRPHGVEVAAADTWLPVHRDNRIQLHISL